MASSKKVSRRQQQALQVWNKLFQTCRNERVDPDEFHHKATKLVSTHPLPSAALADLLLRTRPLAPRYTYDTRVAIYLQRLCAERLIRFSSAISTLLRFSTIHTHAGRGRADPAGMAESAPIRYTNSYGIEEFLFYWFTRIAGQPGTIMKGNDSMMVVDTLFRWMDLFAAASMEFGNAAMAGVQDVMAKQEMESTRAAFVALLIMVFENGSMLSTLRLPEVKPWRKRLSKSLANFIPTAHGQAMAQMAERLEMFRSHTLASFDPVDAKKQEAADAMDELLDPSGWLENFAIPELPLHNSRAGLYIYLNAALVGRPLVDDHALFTHLHNRYQGDAQTTFVALILASFDVLANAVFRNEGQKSAHVLRSFLINKVPLLLAQLAPSVYASGATPEACITRALSQIDTNAFPTLSSMFDDTRNTNPFTDSVREDFTFACCLHGLVPLGNIEAILGESTYQSLPSAGRYTREGLVQECLSDPERAQRLIAELDNMDGNVGAVCQALTELIRRMCANKETLSLKIFCHQLVKKPLWLDVILLFQRPAAILQPLCELLDGFKYEEDQGEYQPVYEEFGAVLLLVLAFVYRFDLTIGDLGIQDDRSFVARLLSEGHRSRPAGELSEQESGHVGRWIQGLFDTEGGGLGDDVISACPPQELYVLVPTILHEIINGVIDGVIGEEGVKSGIEYLVETFLMPTLVTAIRFLAEQLLVDQEPEPKVIIKILQLILLPKAVPGESATILSSILGIGATRLENALHAHQRKNPTSQDVQPLLKALQSDNLAASRRTGAADAKELESWTGTSNSALVSTLKHTVQAFVQWGLNPGMNITSQYTHRQVLMALRMLGAEGVLHVLIDEIKAHGNPDTVAIVYDIATAIACAPDVGNAGLPVESDGTLPDHRISLGEALRLEALSSRRTLKTDAALVEIIVRLHRRVEAQMAPAPLPLQPVEQITDESAAALAIDLGTSAVDVTADLGDAMVAVPLGHGVGAVPGLDLGMGGVVGGTGGSTNGDDIFSGLGSLDGWDSMDNMGMDLG